MWELLAIIGERHTHWQFLSLEHPIVRNKADYLRDHPIIQLFYKVGLSDVVLNFTEKQTWVRVNVGSFNHEI